MENVNTAAIASETVSEKKVGRPVKPSLSFVRKFSDGSRIEVSTELATVKIGGFAPITVGIYKFDKGNEITEADEKKFFGKEAESKSDKAFTEYVSSVIAGTYKFPSEAE